MGVATEAQAAHRATWPNVLAEPFDALRLGGDCRADQHAAVRQALEIALIGDRSRYTFDEFLRMVSADADTVWRLWRSLGLSVSDVDEPAFTVEDVETTRALAQFVELCGLPEQMAFTVGRAIAQSMARLAEWQVEMMRGVLAKTMDTLPTAEALEVVAEGIPLLERIQTGLWRRHLEAGASRALRQRPPDVLSKQVHARVRSLAVGFADLVGFSRTTNMLAAPLLNELIERFEAAATETVVAYGGRIVKGLGDGVLFVADDASTAATIAVVLRDRFSADPGLPELRIGVAAGDVILRLGDVFGDPVNIAARLTEYAEPGTVLADEHLVGMLDARADVGPIVGQTCIAEGVGLVRAWSLNWRTASSARSPARAPNGCEQGGAV